MNMRRWLFVTLFLHLHYAAAGTLGGLSGLVVDSDGIPVRNLTVRVMSQTPAVNREVASDPAGRYRLADLPPGSYRMTATFPEANPLEMDDLKIDVNRTIHLDFTISFSGEKPVITAENISPLNDPGTATLKTVLPRSFMERLPGSEHMDTAFTLFGGIVPPGYTHGFHLMDNVYSIDGMNVTDHFKYGAASLVNTDLIEDIEILTGGFRAEYGRAMGGIYNVTTKSGGNRFHGIFRLKYVDTSWDEELDFYPRYKDYDYLEPSFVLEGPIVRDKLWFTASYRTFDKNDSALVLKDYESDIDTPSDYTELDKSHEFMLPYGKLVFQPVSDHRFEISYSGETNDKNYEEAIISSSRTVDTYSLYERGTSFTSFRWLWRFSSNLHFETFAGLHRIYDYVTPQNTDDDPRNSPFYDRFHQKEYNNSDIWTETDSERIQLRVNADCFIEDLMGLHEWKSGVEIQSVKYEDFYGYPGNALYTIKQIPVGDYRNPDHYTGTDAYRIKYSNRVTREITNDYLGAFLQDTWSVTGNLTLELGLRYETSEFENSDTAASLPVWSWGQFKASDYLNPDGSYKSVAKMKFDDMLAPRIGAVWDIFGDQKSIMKAFYGRYYSRYGLSLAALSMGIFNGENDWMQDYTGPKWTDMNRDGIPDEDFFFDEDNWSEGYNPFGYDVPGHNFFLDPSIKAEHTDEFIIGFNQEISDNFSVGFNYVYREADDLIEDVGLFMDRDGNVIWTYLGGIKDDFSGLDPNLKFDLVDDDGYAHNVWITNVSGAERKYSGCEINARARKKHWDLQFSYTYSEAEGSLTKWTTSGHFSLFSDFFDTYQASQKLYGLMPWSSDHFVKFAGAWHRDFTNRYELSVGMNAYWQSGYHYSKYRRPSPTYDPDYPSNEIDNPETWTGRPYYASVHCVLPEGRGNYEHPSTYRIDVSLQNRFGFGKWGAATIIFDIYNATNEIFNPDESYDDPDYPTLEYDYYIEEQIPRTYRLSLKYEF